MIFTSTDYYAAIHKELLNRPKKIWIASFGCNVGISDIGRVYTGPSYQMFTAINKDTAGSRVLIGCPVSPDRKFFRRLTNSAEYFSEIQWKTHRQCHLKCWIFFYGSTCKALFGGRNVGDSDWADATVWVKNGEAGALAEFYDHLWRQGRDVQRTKKLLVR